MAPSQNRQGMDMVFKELTVSIGSRSILKNVSGLAKPGEILAIMGPSGAGKTTLIECLVGRCSTNEGCVKLNSFIMDNDLGRKVSYVQQSDIFLPEITAWDTIWYNALLRLPDSMPIDEKRRRAEEIVDALDIRKCLKTKIGNHLIRGLSGGEKKRTNIACEILTNPAVILLDEPTSGLDSATANSLMQSLKKFITESGKTMVVTIHQPNSHIFNMFDKLLLLCEGEVAYYGDTKACAEYFRALDLPCSEEIHIAEHIVDCLKGTDEIKAKLKQRAIEQRSELSYPAELKIKEATVGQLMRRMHNMDKSQEKKHQPHVNQSYIPTTDINADAEKGHTEGIIDHSDDFTIYKKDYDRKWPTSFWTQLLVLSRRAFWQALPRVLNKWKVIQMVILGLFVGLFWFQVEPKEEYLRDRINFAYMLMTFASFLNISDGVMSFWSERVVVNKERLGGQYRLLAYYLSKTAVEFALTFTHPIIFYTPAFWMSGLSSKFSVFVGLLVLTFASQIVAQSFGYLCGIAFADPTLGLTGGSTFFVISLISGGLYREKFPFWLDWFKYLSYQQMSVYPMLHLDFTNIDIQCAEVGSKFLSCYNTNETSADGVKYIPRQDLLNTYTLAGSGWQFYHYILWLFGVIAMIRTINYLILRLLQKPQAH